MDKDAFIADSVTRELTEEDFDWLRSFVATASIAELSKFVTEWVNHVPLPQSGIFTKNFRTSNTIIVPRLLEMSENGKR